MKLQTLPAWVKETTAPLYRKVMGGSSQFKPGTKTVETKVFRVTINAAEFMQNLQTLSAADSGFSREMRERDDSAAWCGLRDGEKATGILQQSVSRTAQTDYNNAKGKFETPLIGGSIILSNRGSSFSMGRVLQGHPVSCLRREKTKLPPKTINLLLQASASVQAEDIAWVLSKIIKAAIEYKLAGGIITLKMNFYSGFSKPQNNCQGLWTTVNLPLSNTATLATIASVQGYRALLLSLASCLSGDHGDCLPTSWLPHIPGCIPLSGTREDEAAALTALKLK